jgi:putative hydrolase of the HAD superfamily
MPFVHDFALTAAVSCVIKRLVGSTGADAQESPGREKGAQPGTAAPPTDRMPGMSPLKRGARQTRAVFLDALGTLVELDPPWTHLAVALGIAPDNRLESAFRAEMSYYRSHSHEGRDEASLAALRERCATVLSRELGRQVPVETMMASIRFRAFPDAQPALIELRRRDLRLVCVSNWDCSLPSVLERCGLGAALDGVVDSAEAGARKPDPAIFAPALGLAGCRSAEALHVGDTPEEDVAAARAAGIPVLLLGRDGDGEIASLTEIADHLRV